MLEKSKTKSRNIPIAKFFNILQYEYLLSEIRSKIYPSPKDQSYYEKVMLGKKEKIQDIAEKNQLPTIFDDKEKYKQLLNNLLKNREKYFNDIDYLHYYMKDADVRVQIEGKICIGVIDSFYTETKTVEVVYENYIYSIPCNEVNRIL